MKKKKPTQRELNKLLSYNPKTGKLTWKRRPFGGKSWNAQRAGKEAFTSDGSDNYKRGTIHGEPYTAHKVIWAMLTGTWPTVTHLNKIRNDNRLENLSDAYGHKNLKISGRNTSGFNGVFWDVEKEKWRAVITVDGKKMHLGRFESKADAIAARKAADIKYGFHKNHGT